MKCTGNTAIEQQRDEKANGFVEMASLGSYMIYSGQITSMTSG